jgi:nucleoside-diphosphate-sugar epimerase
MSRILVTGGLGFIGHNVSRLLQDRGHHVKIVDNLTDYGMIPFDELRYLIAERKAKLLPNTMTHQIDIETPVMRHVLADFLPEIVVHLASFPRQRVVNKNPQSGARVMCEGLLNLLELSVKYGVTKFVYVSSSMVYGNFDDDTRENHRCNPRGQYAIMKYCGELLVEDYSARYPQLNTVVVRPSAVYGELDSEDRAISKFMLAAMRGETLKVNGEHELLDFTHVSDAASGIAGAILGDTYNATYNITRSRSVSLGDAARLIHRIVDGGGTIELCDKDPQYPSRGSLNIDAARSDFGYNPTVDVEEGFERYYRWFKSSTYWQKQL